MCFVFCVCLLRWGISIISIQGALRNIRYIRSYKSSSPVEDHASPLSPVLFICNPTKSVSGSRNILLSLSRLQKSVIETCLKDLLHAQIVCLVCFFRKCDSLVAHQSKSSSMQEMWIKKTKSRLLIQDWCRGTEMDSSTRGSNTSLACRWIFNRGVGPVDYASSGLNTFLIWKQK